MARGKIKEKDGHYYMQIVDDLGRETTRSIKKEFNLDKEPTAKQATKYLAKKLAEIESNGLVYDAKITVEDFLWRWHETKKKSVTEDTAEGYRMMIKNHIIPHLGHLRLYQLNKATVQQFIDILSKDNSARLVNYTMMIFKQSLRQAVDWDLIAKNPSQGLILPKEETPEKTMWTDEQLIRFLEINSDNRFITFYQLAITTGMRRGEMLALTWDDVSFETNIISITKSITGERVIKSPKTKNSIRKVNIPSFIAQSLKTQKSINMQWLLAKGIRPKDNEGNELLFDECPVFMTSVGSYFSPRNVLRAFKMSCEKADVPVTNLHSLRHLHVSMLLAEGVDLKTIQHRVGHAKLSTTMDIYSHLLNNTEQTAANKIEERLNRLMG